MFAVIFVAYPKMPAGEADNPALLRVDITLVKEEHAHACVDKERSQQIQHPGKMFDQLCAQRDHHSAHDQRPHHAPFQKAVLQPLIYSKRSKDHQEKEQVVDAEGLFDQIAGKEFQRRLLAIKIEHSESKEDRDCDPAETGEGRLANLDLVRAAVEYAQVQRDRNSDEEVESNPVKGRPHGGARRRQGVEACTSIELRFD